MVRFLRPGDTSIETAEKIAVELNNIDGIFDAHVEEERPHIVEWNMPDQDFRFPSGVTVSQTHQNKISEATIRLGSLGDRDKMDFQMIDQLEGEWVDVALMAASDAGILDKIPEDDFPTFVDLGDRYIESQARPHFRLLHKKEPYQITPREFVDFVEILAERFERQFGTLQDRASDPEMAQFFT